MPARKPSQPETTAMVATTERPNSISAALLRARLRTVSVIEAPDLMNSPAYRRIFGTLNIAISFPAAGTNVPVRERGERSVKRAVRGLSLIHISEPTRQAEISYAV